MTPYLASLNFLINYTKNPCFCQCEPNALTVLGILKAQFESIEVYELYLLDFATTQVQAGPSYTTLHVSVFLLRHGSHPYTDITVQSAEATYPLALHT